MEKCYFTLQMTGCTWSDFVHTWKGCAICLEGEPNFYFLSGCPWNLETHWVTDFGTEALMVCPQDFDSVARGWQRAASFGLEFPCFFVPIKLPAGQTRNLESHPLQLYTDQAVKELDELTCFHNVLRIHPICKYYSEKNIAVVFPKNCTVIFQIE